MAKVVFRARLRKWGNSYGVAVSRKDADRLKAREGSEITITAERGPVQVDFSDVAVLHGLDPHLSERHDEYLGEAMSEKYDRQRRRGRRRA